MSRNTRRIDITTYINTHGYVSFNELKSRFSDVSDMTLRMDLKELGEQGKIIRVRGGAKPVQETARPDDSYFLRTTRNLEPRQRIARKAVEYLKKQLAMKPTVSIFLDAGVTINEIAKIFPDEWCTIVTNGIANAYELATLKRPSITVLGGTLNRYNCNCDSVSNIDTLERLNFDIAFIPAAGYSPEAGFTCGKEVIDEIRDVIKEHSQKVIVPIDSSKIGVVYPVTHLKISEVDIIISDDELPPHIKEHFIEMGVEVL